MRSSMTDHALRPVEGFVQALRFTPSPSFATDETGQVIAWNPACERLLGISEAEALGREAHLLLHGAIVEAHCFGECPLREALSTSKSVEPAPIPLRDGRGATRQLTCTVLAFHPEAHGIFVIQLHEAGPQPALAAEGEGAVTTSEARGSNPLLASLTRRERELLRLLRRGLGTAELAREMGISTITVRNHVQRLMRKLGVHSRVAALAVTRELAPAPSEAERID